MKRNKSFVALTALALLLPLAVRAQRSDPELGTWKLNVAKSKFDPAPAPQSVTRTYEMTADGIKETGERESATGEKQAFGVTFKRDGKSYPYSGSPNYDALAVTRIGSLQWKAKLFRAGKTVGHTDIHESKDHSILTLDSTYTTPSGQRVHDLGVYDRQ